MYEAALILSVVIFAATAAVYMRQPIASIFHPATFYLMFHGLVFVVRPIFGWYYGYTNIYKAMHFTPSLWDKMQTLLCTNLALVVFMAVMLLITREPLEFRQDGYDLAQRRLVTARFLLVVIVLGGLAVYSIYWLWEFQSTNEGGVAELDARSGTRTMTATNGYFYGSSILLAPIVAIIAFLGRFKLWSLAPFVAFAVFRLGTGQRGDFVAGAVMIALLFMYDRRRKWPTMAVVVAALVLVPVFDSIQDDRGARIRAAFGFEVGERYESLQTRYEQSREKPLESQDLSNMEMVEYLTWAIPERSGSYDYFLQNLQLFTEPIPRALWKDKPIGAPIKMFDLYSHAISVGGVWSVPGMGWMYWGYAGVAIWSAFFAWIYASGYNLFVRSRQSNLAVIAYVIFLATAIIAYRDGTILTILKQVLFYFAPLAMLFLLCRVTKLPSKDQLRRLWTTLALESQGLPDSPHGRRFAAAGHEPPAVLAPERSPLDGVALSPRARRRARMAELS